MTTTAYQPAGSGTGEPSSVLLLDTQLNISERETFHRTVRQLHTIQGVQNHSQVEITFDPAIEQLVIHHVATVRDGTTTDAASPDAFKLIQRESNLEFHLYDGRLNAVLLLEDVQLGDTVDLAYTLRAHSPIFEDHLTHWHHSDHPFPVGAINLSVTVPSGTTLHYRTSRQDDQPEISAVDSATVHRWTRHNVPANSSETGAPTSLIQGNWLQLSTFGSWHEIAELVAKKWRAVAAACPALDAKIEEIEAGATSPEDRALLASDFVQNEFRYLALASGISGWVPSPIDTVFTRRFADCKDKAALLCALLNRLGIPARPVLVHTRLLGRINDLLPSTGLFDHVIVQMNIGGGSVFIDPTLQDQRGIIRNRATPYFHFGLPIDPTAKSLIHIEPPSKKRDNIEVTERFILAQRSFDPTALVSTRVTGMEADRLRHLIRSLGAEKASEQLASHYTTNYPGASRVGAIEEHEEEHGESTLVVSEQFVLPDFGTTLNDGSAIRFVCSAHSIAAQLVNPTYRERHTPLALHYPIRVTHQIDIETPGSKRIPKSENKIEDKHFTLTVRSEGSVKGLRLHYTFITLAPEVQPRDLRTYLDHVNEASDLLHFQLDIPLLRGFPFRHKSSKPLTDEQPDFAELDSAPKSGLANRKTGAVAPLYRRDGQESGIDYTLDLDELVELEASGSEPHDPHVLDQQGTGGRAPALKEGSKSFIVGSGDDTMQRWSGNASQTSALNVVGILGGLLVIGVLYAAFTGVFTNSDDNIYERPEYEMLAGSPAFIAARTATAAGDYTNALAQLDEIDKRYPDNPDALAARADIEMRQGDTDAAAKSANAALGIYGTHPDALAVLGEVSLSRNNPAEAIRLLNNSLSIAPNNTETLEKLGNTYVAVGNLPAAELAFNKLLTKKPAQISAIISLATVHNRRGSHFTALDIFRKARQDFPDNIEIALAYAKFLADDEEYVAAIHEAQAALVLDSTNRKTLQAIADIYAMAGDEDNAQIFEERARFAE